MTENPADEPVGAWKPETWSDTELLTAARVVGGIGRKRVADELERRLSIRLTCTGCHHTHAPVELDCADCPECGGHTFTVEPMEHS